MLSARNTPISRVALRALSAALLCCVCACASAEDINLEIACFRGGYGLDHFEQLAREYEKQHPNVKINLWGSPRIWDQLVPRFASGSPPDIAYPGWGTNVFAMIYEGQILQLDKYMDQPGMGSTKPWRDTFLPALLRKGSYQGKVYTLPFEYGTFGWWYNKKMFEQHGWPVPRTYDELLTVSELIKKQHIAPVTFTGRYPQYMLDGFFWPWVQRAGGKETLKQIDALTPGCWSLPPVQKAAHALLELKKRGCFEAGAIGMSHIESQMEFLVGRAAMIPNGTWIYTEMEKMLPPGFEMEYMLCPTFTEGAGDPTAVTISYDGKGWCAASATRHPDVAVDFLKYLTSPDSARRFMKSKGTLMAISDVGEEAAPPHLRGVMHVIAAAKSDYSVQYADWYPELATAVQNSLRDLYNEILTPEQFGDVLNKAFADVRNDPNRRKFGSDE
jgi:N-acetylglucosamine transport system substrate-binding protein